MMDNKTQDLEELKRQKRKYEIINFCSCCVAFLIAVASCILNLLNEFSDTDTNIGLIFAIVLMVLALLAVIPIIFSWAKLRIIEYTIKKISRKMKIVVINGTEKHGVTYKLKELFLENFRSDAEITEYYLPKDCPSFCLGCTNCFMKGENTCKDYPYINAIENSLLQADLIVFTSPAYVMHTTGAMKALLDHFGYRWMPHRPATEMFEKRAVIITQCLGAGAKSTAKDIKHSLSWWGISKIGVFTGSLMSDIIWDKIPKKKRKKLTNSINHLANKFMRIDYSEPGKTKLSVKIKFAFCRIIQKKVRKNGVIGVDNEYWFNNGWLNKNRPWKELKEENDEEE